MEQYFGFLIKASVGIILFYFLYWLFLRKETYYKINRFFLLFALLLSVILPVFPYHYTVLVETGTQTGIFEAIGDTFKKARPAIANNENSAASIRFIEIIFIIYLTGISIFLFRLLAQSAILVRLIIKYRIKSLNGLRIVENQKYGLPFSFFNIVFINPKFHKKDDLPEILAHEKVHIRENHWADLLIIELLTVIFWFNPFIWFFERSIKQNHEYLADNAVLQNGSKVAKYQALLVNQLMGMQIIGVTNNLNFALNKNRLKMMTKQKTPKIRAFKLAWALPAIVFLLFAFAEPEYKPMYPADKSSKQVKKKKLSKKDALTINGKVINKSDGTPIPRASIQIKGTSIGAISGKDGAFTLVDPNPAKKTGEEGSFSLESNLVISCIGYKTMHNIVTASGDALKTGKYTFKLKEGVIKLDLQEMLKEVPPPPPPPKEKKVAKVDKNVSGDVPPPPPPPPAKNEIVISESLPVYPGGQAALAGYIKKAAKKYAKVKKVKGNAVMGFTVGKTGKVENINIIEKDNDLAAKAAYAIISKLEDWKPGSQNGETVPVNYKVPIEF